MACDSLDVLMGSEGCKVDVIGWKELIEAVRHMFVEIQVMFHEDNTLDFSVGN